MGEDGTSPARAVVPLCHASPTKASEREKSPFTAHVGSNPQAQSWEISEKLISLQDATQLGLPQTGGSARDQLLPQQGAAVASSPGDTLSTAARVSSDPPASPEDDAEELVELSCIQGWVFSLPRGDALQQSH